ncbi:MAG: hypothetical protein A2139_03210 [Desulfobacca sp. RBG_16_60_12]|nr:MAG: hypothetical protein A2139_03210 [Desulfobacca sp. RBG_16_60_12]
MLKFFFDVPVYRVPEEKYYREMNEYIERNMFPGPAEHNDSMRVFYSREPEQEVSHREHLREQFGGAWNYNEIIGYIRLHFLGNQIRGEYWGVKAKRQVRTRKKIFKYMTWKIAPEINIPNKADNEEIFKLILDYLTRCSKELRGRHIDTTILKSIGQYVDWKSLLVDR